MFRSCVVSLLFRLSRVIREEADAGKYRAAVQAPAVHAAFFCFQTCNYTSYKGFPQAKEPCEAKATFKSCVVCPCRIQKSWDNPDMRVWLFVKANLIFISKTARTWLYGVCMCVCPQCFAMGVSSLLIMLMSRATTCPWAVFFISIALGLYSFTSG